MDSRFRLHFSTIFVYYLYLSVFCFAETVGLEDANLGTQGEAGSRKIDFEEPRRSLKDDIVTAKYFYVYVKKTKTRADFEMREVLFFDSEGEKIRAESARMDSREKNYYAENCINGIVDDKRDICRNKPRKSDGWFLVKISERGKKISKIIIRNGSSSRKTRMDNAEVSLWSSDPRESNFNDLLWKTTLDGVKKTYELFPTTQSNNDGSSKDDDDKTEDNSDKQKEDEEDKNDEDDDKESDHDITAQVRKHRCAVDITDTTGSTDDKKNAKGKPNIVFSLADDMGWNDIGYANEEIKTPVLDDLAKNGIRLDRHYAFRFCSPSRSMLLAGILPFKHGQHTDLNLNPVSEIECAIQSKLKFFPEYMQDAGYKTYMVGKWHMGHYSTLFTPTLRGFDEFVGIYNGATNQINNTKLNGYRGPIFSRNRKNFERIYYELANSTKETISVAPLSKFLTAPFADGLLASEAARMIQHHDFNIGPFFLYASWTAPHNPIIAPDYLVERNKGIGNICRRRYAGMMSGLDDANKVVIDTIKEQDQWNKTLFIFASDNGGFSAPGKNRCDDDRAQNFVGSNYPLRGSKFNFWEGGVRVRSFMYSKNEMIIPKSRRGTTFSGLMSMTDWYRTILTAVDVDVDIDEEHAVDSVDMWEALKSKSGKGRTMLHLQTWKASKKYQNYIGYQVVDGKLYKYIKGYPGESEFKDSRAASGVVLPYGLKEEDTPDYLKIYSPYSSKTCRNSCLFCLNEDESEMTNLLTKDSEKYESLIKDWDDVIDQLPDGEEDSSRSAYGPLCRHYKKKKGLRIPKTTNTAMKRYNFCDFIVPWKDSNFKDLKTK